MGKRWLKYGKYITRKGKMLAEMVNLWQKERDWF